MIQSRMQRVALDNDGVKAKTKYDLQTCGSSYINQYEHEVRLQMVIDTVFSFDTTVFRHFTRMIVSLHKHNMLVVVFDYSTVNCCILN